MRQVISELESHEKRISNLETQDVSPGFFNLHSAYLSLPMLRLYYPFNRLTPSGTVLDLGGSNLNASVTNTLTIHERYGTFASSSYVAATSSNETNITGTESYVASGFKGLTWGLWFNPSAAPTGEAGIFAKYRTLAGLRQYALNCMPSLEPKAVVSTDGNSASAEVTSGTSMEVGKWYFIVGRFIPSTNLGVFVNGAWTYDTTSMPASIHTSATPLVIPGFQGPAGTVIPTRGSVAHAFICAAALPDAMIMNLFNRTRHLYGA